MSDSIVSGGTGPVRKKKSKLEKIAELESSLKLSKEENRRLKKEVHLLKSVGPSSNGPMSPRHNKPSFNAFPSSSSSNNNNPPFFNNDEMDKMKDALKALKRVSINQEMSLQALRAKASQRRQELEARDRQIHKLQRHIQSLQKQLQRSNTHAPSDILQQCHALQEALHEKESTLVDVQDQLQEAHIRIKTLERNHSHQHNHHPLERSPSNSSLKSFGDDGQSVSTAQEFDLSKLKKEIAKKSSKIVDLEYQLELVKDQLHEVKGMRNTNNNGNMNNGEPLFADDFAGTDNPFGGDAFANHHNNGDDFYEDAGGGGEDEDDWWWKKNTNTNANGMFHPQYVGSIQGTQEYKMNY